MSKEDYLYKVLNEDGSTCWGGGCRWPLPRENAPGEWVNVKGELEETSEGLHLCRIRALPFWIGPAIFLVEHEGEIKNEESDTPLVRRARLLSRIESWNRYTLEKFARDCYEHVKNSILAKHTTKKEVVAQLEETFKGKVFSHIPRLAAEVSQDYEKELDWQVERLLNYMQINQQ